MSSPKPPLHQLMYQGSPGKSLLFKKDCGASPRPTSENCDPNLEKAKVPGGDLAVFPKNDTCAAASGFEFKQKDLSKEDHAPLSHAWEEEREEGEQNRNKDKGTPHKCGARFGIGQQQLQQFKSPTKAAAATSPGGGHVHGHRQHFCRSPRCASNNPDYATPAQVPPRKYLISKRHLIPGAICTRDPSTIPSSQIPLPPSLSSGKPPARPPPASASKHPTTNAFRQLSFQDASSDTNTSVPAGNGGALTLPDTDCGGAATEPAAAGSCVTDVGSISDEPTLLQNDEQIGEEQNDVDTASESQLQEQQRRDGIDEEPVNYDSKSGEKFPCDEGQDDVEQLRSNGNEGDSSPELGSETSSDVEGDDSTPSTCGAGDQIPGSVTSVETDRCESSDLEAVAEESSDSSARSLPPVPGDASKEKPVPVAFSGLTDGQGSDKFLSSPALLDSAGEPPLDVDDVTQTLKQRLALDEMEVTNSPRRQSSCDDGIIDIYDLATTSSTSGSEDETASVEEDYISRDCPTEEGFRAENGDTMESEVSVSQSSRDDFEDKAPQDGQTDERFIVVENEVVSREPETASCKSAQEPEVQRVPPRFGRSKGRQLWRNDIRDSREVVNLRPTNYDRHGGDWKFDSRLEGAIGGLKPVGEGRVRLLVEAFESLMNITEPEPEKRPSRLWCFNRMGKGVVDHDGVDCGEGDQRVDCYEVSGDRFELRASMRLSLGGSSRHDICSVDDDEEMNSMQKVEEWDDRQVNASDSGESKEVYGEHDQNKGSSSTKRAGTTVKSPLKGQSKCNEKEKKRLQMYMEVKKQLGYKTEDNVKMKIQRYNRPKGSKSSSVKSETESNPGSAEKRARALRNTSLEPFRLLTEERGALKDYQFARKLEQLFAEEERLRNPIAQGLPWTTDEPQVVPKPPVKLPTKHVDFSHYSDSRAAMRAEFDNYIAEREMYMKMQREEEDRRRQIAEQEEVKRLRREMVPRAQLMPFFDQPFMPSRSSKRLTVPKEPNFKTRQHKRAKCMVFQQGST